MSEIKGKLGKWAEMFASRRADKFKETELLPDFLSDVFCDVLGYQRPADNAERYTFSREKHVQVDGKFADAVLGQFRPGQNEYTVALEGKGPLDPLDRPHAGRKMSAVDQGYRYAINLPADWIIVTSMRQTRLYHKGSDQYTFQRFDTEKLFDDDRLFGHRHVRHSFRGSASKRVVFTHVCVEPGAVQLDEMERVRFLLPDLASPVSRSPNTPDVPTKNPK